MNIAREGILRKTVLVVDDDAAILDSLQYLLEDAGYTVVTAENGSIIYDYIRTHKPNIILLDYWLPKTNGGLITRQLKTSTETKDIPVLIISASYNIKELVEQAGADDFIPKPYDMQDLLHKIEQFTG